MSRAHVLLLIVILTLPSGYFLYQKHTRIQASAVIPPLRTITLTYENNSIYPRTLSLKTGEMVVFLNKEATPHWPISKECPDLNSKKSLNKGASFRYTPTRTGVCRFYDSLQKDEQLLQGELSVSQ